VEKIELPEPDGHTVQGTCLSRIQSAGALVHRVWAPLSGRIIAVNSRLETETDLINTDPCHGGWLVRIIPSSLEEELPILTQR
jgi:glycine cleavage system H protein